MFLVRVNITVHMGGLNNDIEGSGFGVSNFAGDTVRIQRGIPGGPQNIIGKPREQCT